MVTLDEKEARIVLALIQAAGHSGLINGDGWRETAGGFLLLEAKIKAAFAAKPAEPTKANLAGEGA